MDRISKCGPGPRLAPCLVVANAARAVEFYSKAFAAVEVCRRKTPDGRVCEAEVRFGFFSLFIVEECFQGGFRSPQRTGGSPVGLRIYVANVDELVSRAVGQGAVILHPVEDGESGSRSATILDPLGHVWTICSEPEFGPIGWRGTPDLATGLRRN